MWVEGIAEGLQYTTRCISPVLAWLRLVASMGGDPSPPCAQPRAAQPSWRRNISLPGPLGPQVVATDVLNLHITMFPS